jgi:hypothetical protein
MFNFSIFIIQDNIFLNKREINTFLITLEIDYSFTKSNDLILKEWNQLYKSGLGLSIEKCEAGLPFIFNTTAAILMKFRYKFH